MLVEDAAGMQNASIPSWSCSLPAHRLREAEAILLGVCSKKSGVDARDGSEPVTLTSSESR